MFDRIFGKKPMSETSAEESGQDLIFKSAKAAFDIACKYHDNELRPGAVLTALVEPEPSAAELSYLVARSEDGRQTRLIKVASDDGGFWAFTQTMKPRGPELQAGDLVGWSVIAHHPTEFTRRFLPDPRAAWMGAIICVLEPVLNVRTGWKVREWFVD